MYFLDQKYESKVYPYKPSFIRYIKVGFTGVYISRTCFPDVSLPELHKPVLHLKTANVWNQASHPMLKDHEAVVLPAPL